MTIPEWKTTKMLISAAGCCLFVMVGSFYFIKDFGKHALCKTYIIISSGCWSPHSWQRTLQCFTRRIQKWEWSMHNNGFQWSYLESDSGHIFYMLRKCMTRYILQKHLVDIMHNYLSFNRVLHNWWAFITSSFIIGDDIDHCHTPAFYV